MGLSPGLLRGVVFSLRRVSLLRSWDDWRETHLHRLGHLLLLDLYRDYLAVSRERKSFMTRLACR